MQFHHYLQCLFLKVLRKLKQILKSKKKKKQDATPSTDAKTELNWRQTNSQSRERQKQRHMGDLIQEMKEFKIMNEI